MNRLIAGAAIVTAIATSAIAYAIFEPRVTAYIADRPVRMLIACKDAMRRYEGKKWELISADFKETMVAELLEKAGDTGNLKDAATCNAYLQMLIRIDEAREQEARRHRCTLYGHDGKRGRETWGYTCDLAEKWKDIARVERYYKSD